MKPVTMVASIHDSCITNLEVVIVGMREDQMLKIFFLLLKNDMLLLKPVINRVSPVKLLCWQ